MSRSFGQVIPSINLPRWTVWRSESAVGLGLAVLPIVFLVIALTGLVVPALAVGVWLLLVPLFVTWVAVPSSDRAEVLALVSVAMLVRVVLGAVLLAVMQKA